MKKALMVSLVIPVYNEENHIQACLEAVSVQTVAPCEVIVVDNNSSDNTVFLARQFPFVKVISEKKQGLIPARNRGFAEATGDILARIDADTELGLEWVERVQASFESDERLWGITGLGKAIIDPHFKKVQSTYWPRMYFIQMHDFFRARLLWGANMAITRRAWNTIRKDACEEDAWIHEDQDLSLLIGAAGGKIVLDKDLTVKVDGYQSSYLPKALEYYDRAKKTRNHHAIQGTLQQAQANTHIRFRELLAAKLLLIPVTVMYGVLSGIYSMQVWLGEKYPAQDYEEM